MTITPGDDDGAEEITFVGPAAAAARMAELMATPGMAARVAAVRAEMDAADRAAADEREHTGRDAG